MLETALQSSSCEGDEYAERLYVVIHDAFEANPSSLHKSHPQFSHRSRVPGPFVSRNCLGAFDCFKLGYKVDWPIGLILTPTALSLYSEVFTFLIRTKLTVYGLEDTWQYLQVIGRSLDKSRQASDYEQQKKRFRMLQLFRQQIGHVVTTVQYYVESQLHHVVWGRFVDSVQQQVCTNH
jgi:gamma-tubulin complex component 6